MAEAAPAAVDAAGAAAAQARATAVGFTAVLMWGLLALFTTLSGEVPPFQLTAMSFVVATLLAVAKWAWCRELPWQYLRQPPPVWLLGVAGLFGYHFFYFMALRNAPAVDASLIAYLWPLLIVVFSAMLPGERLRWWHVAGTMAGLAGSVLLVTNGGRVVFRAEFTPGYLSAAACALTWSTYSVLSRRLGTVPTDAVGGFCAVTALAAWLCHLSFEQTVWPADAGEWLAVLALGLGPVGAAFYTWDRGVKRGNIRVLGAASYAAPLISTVVLVAFGQAEPGWVIAAACVLIVGGAVLAARELLFRSRTSPP